MATLNLQLAGEDDLESLSTGIEEEPELDRRSQTASAALVHRHTTLPAEVRRSFVEGLELLNSGEARQAATCFEGVVAAAPNFCDGHVGLGIAYAVDSRIYPALDHLQKGVELDPANFYAHFKLGQLYFKLRLVDKGYAEMAQALDCAITFEQRKLVAALLRKEREREPGSLKRPAWNRPFSRSGIYIGVGLGLAVLTMMLLHIH